MRLSGRRSSIWPIVVVSLCVVSCREVVRPSPIGPTTLTYVTTQADIVDQGKGSWGRLQDQSLDIWAVYTGRWCAANLTADVFTYAFGGGTFDTRGPQLDAVTVSHESLVRPEETFSLSLFPIPQLWAAWSDSGYDPGFRWFTRITYGWAEVTCSVTSP